MIPCDWRAWRKVEDGFLEAGQVCDIVLVCIAEAGAI